ncbi:unnamed protein product [Brassica oleracea]
MLADGLHTLDQFGSNEGLEWAGEEEEPGDEELHEDGLDALMASMEQPLTITDSEAKETITGDGTIQIEGNGHQSNERGTEEVQVETKTGTRKPAGLPTLVSIPRSLVRSSSLLASVQCSNMVIGRVLELSSQRKRVLYTRNS